MKLYHAVYMHRFELRHCWQVSSIMQQLDAPETMLDVAGLEGDENPLRFPGRAQFPVMIGENQVGTEDYSSTYHPTPRETFARRGLVRNEQIARAHAAGADWIFFSDADNVYHPHFFRELGEYLEGPGKDVTNCIASHWKAHTEVEATDEAVQVARSSPWVADAYARAADIPVIRKRNRRVAAGCMQVVSMKAIEEINDGWYIPPGVRCKDGHLFKSGEHAKSDIQFRRFMGGSHMIDLPIQIHLNHRRDKEEGGHIEVQR